MTIDELYITLQKRSKASVDESYTAKLTQDGIDRIAQKVGEEAVEVVIASKNNDKELLVGEISDLYYHLVVLMINKNVTLDDVYKELARRHVEKSK